METVRLEIPDKLVWVFEGEADVRGAYGGRGSAKTRTFAKMTAVRAHMWAQAGVEGVILCARQFMNSLAESSLEEIKAAIRETAWLKPFFEIGEKYIRTICGRISYVFAGLDRSLDSIKSKARILLAWVDEACWIDLIEDVWDNLMFGLRLDYGVPGGARVLATSTPRPIKWLKARLAEPNTRLVRVSTYENIDNLDPHFRERIINKYEGTRKGRQELHGEILEDVEGALWNTAMIDNYRFDEDPTDLERIVVALDPAGSKTKRSDETGIIVVGKKGTDFYVLADYSGKYSPAGWAEKARQAFECHQADRIVVERNFGGDLVGSTLENVGANLPVQQVTSRRGKALRAEPVAALYEKGRVHHPRTKNPAYWPDLQTAEESLEEQMCQWVPGDADSPDRLDALVHGLVALAGLSSDSGIAVAPASMSVR